MKKKLLFTGNGSLLIDDLIKHLPEEYIEKKCPVEDTKFTEDLEIFCPNAIVICLSKESQKSLNVYNILSTNLKYKNLLVIIMGNEDECEYFVQNISIENLKILPRPINMSILWETLNNGIIIPLKKEVKLPTQPILFEDELEKIAKLQVETAAISSAKKPIKRINFTNIRDRQTILVVDDDTRILNIIKLYLQDLYEVIIVPSGKLALKYLSKHSADLVLLDYMMPVEDGPTVLKQIRENSPHPNIPVLFLTGVADKELVMRGLEFRPDGYCLKPITQDALIERITAILLNL